MMQARVQSSAEVEDRAPNFDRLAGIYRWMEWLSFGPYLARCRGAFLDGMAGRRCALVIGDGDGRFTSKLMGANPDIEVDAVDASAAMLAALVRRAGAAGARVRTEVADARRWRPAGNRHYDLVVTHFFLDCLTTEEVRGLAAAVRPGLRPGALWVVSEFAVPDGGFGRLAAGPLVWALYRAFGALTGLRVRRLPEYRDALAGAGLRLGESRSFLGGVLVSEVWVANEEWIGTVEMETPP